MKIVIETFVTIFFITVTVFIAAQVIGAGIQVSNAKEFHINASKGIEDSGLSLEIVEQMKRKARELGYELEVSFSGEDVLRCGACNSAFSIASNKAVCSNCGSKNIYVEGGKKRGLVTLDYKVEVEMLGVSREGSIQSYVR